jgi:hypothetical protein
LFFALKGHGFNRAITNTQNFEINPRDEVALKSSIPSRPYGSAPCVGER